MVGLPFELYGNSFRPASPASSSSSPAKQINDRCPAAEHKTKNFLRRKKMVAPGVGAWPENHDISKCEVLKYRSAGSVELLL